MNVHEVVVEDTFASLDRSIIHCATENLPTELRPRVILLVAKTPLLHRTEVFFQYGSLISPLS